MRRLIVVGLVAAAWVAAVPTADANVNQWRNGSLGGNQKDASPTYDELRASRGYAVNSGWKVDVAAHYPGGWTLYGNWVEGWYYACHPYSGANDLGAMLMNPHSVSQSSMIGIANWLAWENAC